MERSILITEYSFSSYTSGMMFQSDGSYAERLYREDGTPLLCVTEKVPFGDETARVYRVAEDVFPQLQALAESADLFALAELREREKPLVFDYSCGSGITFYYEEAQPDGSRRRNYLQLNPTALSEHGFGAFTEQLNALIKRCIIPENLLSETVTQRRHPAVPTGEAEQQPGEDEWKCGDCGCIVPVTSKFCPECGRKRE